MPVYDQNVQFLMIEYLSIHECTIKYIFIVVSTIFENKLLIKTNPTTTTGTLESRSGLIVNLHEPTALHIFLIGLFSCDTFLGMFIDL